MSSKLIYRTMEECEGEGYEAKEGRLPLEDQYSTYGALA